MKRHIECEPITFGAAVFLSVCLAPLTDVFSAPEQYGPHAIGHHEATLVDATRNNHSLHIDFWYPATLNDSSELTSYRFTKSLDFGFPSENAYRPAIIDGSRVFPLLISSHGTALSSVSQASVNESLASHGFIVVAANHTGDSYTEVVAGTNVSVNAVAADRIKDVRFLIDHMLEANLTAGHDFEGAVDGDKIGVLGLSYGGVTSFASHLGALGIEGDARVKAIMPMTSGRFPWMGLSTTDLKSSVPTLLLNGTNDNTRSDSAAAFDYVASEERYLAEIIGARHLSYTDVCAWRDYATANGAPPQIQGLFDAMAGGQWQTCSANTIDNDEAIKLTSELAASFFRGYLNGDTEYLTYLSADYFDGSLPVRFLERGDVTRDGKLDVKDIDTLIGRIQKETPIPRYDIDRDGTVNGDDLGTLIHDDLETFFGDTNLDGEFNTGDLVIVFSAGEYEDAVAVNSGWAGGDWNGDGEFTSDDLTLALADGGYEAGPRAAAVPEPSSFPLLALALGSLILCRKPVQRPF